jgi:hypothetical protein
MCGEMKTRLVYRFNEVEAKLGKANFHCYIDNKPNLLVLAALDNGYVVGAFTKYPLCKDHIEKPGDGFLFNVNNQVIYPVRSDAIQPVAGYDDYFLVLGNSEFRLRSQELKFFSNFGTSTCTFNAKGHKRLDFMGS